MAQNRCQNSPKSRSGGGLGGSWSLSGRLGRILGLAGRVLGRLGHVLGRLGRRPGRVLGRPGGVLGAFEASLGASSDVLGRLGGVLGLIFAAKEAKIEAFHLGWHFFIDFGSILRLKIKPRTLKNH